MGERAAEAKFFEAWMSITAAERPLLVYNSGRLIDDILQLLPQTNLPSPDILVGGVGTMLLRFNCPGDSEAYSRSFASFDRELIEALAKKAVPRIERQPDEYQSEFKSSWFLRDAVAEELREVDTVISNAGMRVTLIYSSDRDLDILPVGISKGSALAWLCRRFAVGTDELLVAGDTNNDRTMFKLPGARGIVVGNAHAELRKLAENRDLIYAADQREAFGVVEGLCHFGLIAASTVRISAFSETSAYQQ